jgi:hypothetical protein
MRPLLLLRLLGVFTGNVTACTSHLLMGVRRRLDNGYDSIENIDRGLEPNETCTPGEAVDFVIQWNPRQERQDEWLGSAERHGRWA